MSPSLLSYKYHHHLKTLKSSSFFLASMAATTGTTGSPCGACKFLRRKCASDCIFAPYFCSEQGPDRFASIHKIFGASNVSKLLQQVPAHDRCEAVVTIAYEAQTRIRDPVYGCVAHIFALQQQVAVLQAQLMQARAQIAQGMAVAGVRLVPEDYWQSGAIAQSHMSNAQSISLVDCMDCSSDEGLSSQQWNKRRAATLHGELGELQAVALRMMRN